MSSNPQDLSPQARIRVAAVHLFGQQGFAATTIRQIAARAGVSPALVLHHYGSRDGLREACDDWVIDMLGSEKALMIAGPVPPMKEYLDAHPELAGVMEYLVAALREGGEMASRVFDRLVEMTRAMLRTAAERGLVRPLADEDATVAMLVAQSCGTMMMGAELARSLGGGSLTEPAVLHRYLPASLELMAGTVFEPAYVDALRASVATLEGPR